MFNNLSSKITHILGNIKKKPVLSAQDLDDSLRELRIALLEADVALVVVRELIQKIKQESEGRAIYDSVSPYQMIVKIIYDELVNILGNNAELIIKDTLTSYMLVGLQGSGKTTTAAKLAYYLKNKHKKRVLVVSLDTERLAAYEQLEILSKQIDVDFYQYTTKDASKDIVAIVALAKKQAIQFSYDSFIIDTAGRLVTNEALMQELTAISLQILPNEILLVADSMMGQTSSMTAKEFNDRLQLSGIILSKIDGDGRGGAALSMKAVTQVPLKFSGVGEKVTDLEAFIPTQVADRILGKGDIVSLVDRISESVYTQDEEALQNKLESGKLNLEVYAQQLKNMQKIGGLNSIMSMIPGVSSLSKKFNPANTDNKLLQKQLALINSMNKQEKKNPKILNASRKIRIAKGAGLKVQDLNSMLKQYNQMLEIMKKFKGGGLKQMMNLVKSQKRFS